MLRFFIAQNIIFRTIDGAIKKDPENHKVSYGESEHTKG
jgi:hypothetical protein